jgi:hypothetical protein
MDSKIEDGDGLTSDPIPWETRSSPTFEKAFLDLCTRSLEKLRGHQTRILRYLAADQSIALNLKGKSQEQLMASFVRYVS